MSRQFQLNIAMPQKEVVDTEVISVIVPSEDGYMGIMYGHQPMVTHLQSGFVMFISPNGAKHYIAVYGGFLEVQANKVRILADGAVWSKDIDKIEAQKTIEVARRALKGELSDMTIEQATHELEQALSRLLTLRVSGQKIN